MAVGSGAIRTQLSCQIIMLPHLLYSKRQISLTLCDLYNTQISTFMYNYSKSNVPCALLQIFTPNNTIHSHQTRHSSDIHITHINFETVLRSLICRCPDIWLSLPNDIKQSASSKVFKHKIKRHYIIQYLILYFLLLQPVYSLIILPFLI